MYVSMCFLVFSTYSSVLSLCVFSIVRFLGCISLSLCFFSPCDGAEIRGIDDAHEGPSVEDVAHVLGNRLRNTLLREEVLSCVREGGERA